MKLRELSDEAKRCQTARGAAMLLAVIRWLAGSWTDGETLAEVADRLCEHARSDRSASEGMLRVSEVAEQLGVKQHTVLAWIHSGEMYAINVATDPDEGRPTWRIHRDDMNEFVESRSSKPSGTPPPTVGGED